MSNTIDQRVVEMDFDNSNFERNTKTTMATIDSLKNKLNFGKSTESLSELNTTAKGMDFSVLTNGLSTVGTGFSAMSVIGITALANITNAAVNTAKRLVSALTIQPISQGYGDYERKLTSVQTIMNATGESIETVSGYFSELDTYADKTIYNLGDMTSSFAKFTNAGVDMDKSVPAIKGIANMVALAGQGANAASVAMYNLSQSIAGGFLTTMDYRSLNLQNVATKEWKQNMADAAVAAGTLKKKAEGVYTLVSNGKEYNTAKLFTEALSEQWATTDILLKVLGDYGDTTTAIGAKAQSAAQDVKSFSMMMETLAAGVGTGWTDTFEIVIGDLEESKKLFTNLTNTIDGFLSKMSDSRNALLGEWKDNGGRQTLIDSFELGFSNVSKIFSNISSAFNSAFDGFNADDLLHLTNVIFQFFVNLQITQEESNNFRETMNGVFYTLASVWEIFKSLLTIFKPLFPFVRSLADSFLSLTAGFGEYAYKVNLFLKYNDKFKNGVEKTAEIFEKVLGYISRGVKGVVDGINEFKKAGIISGIIERIAKRITDVITAFKDFGKNTAEVGDDLKQSTSWFSNLLDICGKTFDFIVNIGGIIGKLAGDIFSNLGKAISSINFKGFFDMLNASLTTGSLIGILKFIFQKSKEKATKGNILQTISNTLDELLGCITAYQDQIKSKVLMNIATAIGILAAALFVLSLLDSGKLTLAIVAMGGLFAMLAVFMGVMKKMNMISSGGEKKGIVAFFKNLFGNASSGIDWKALIGISVSVLILATALVKIGKLNFGQMMTGLVGLAGVMGELFIFLKLTEKITSKLKPSTGLALIGIAASINLFYYAIKNLGNLDSETLVKGISSMGAVLLEIAAFLTILSLNFSTTGISSGRKPNLIQISIGMVILAASMKIFASSLKDLGSVDVTVINKGLLSMGTLLILIAAALRVMPKDTFAKATSLVVIAGAFKILETTFISFGNMDWEQIQKALLVFSVSIGIIVAALVLLNKFVPNIKPISKSLLIISASIVILAGALKMLGNMSLGQVLTGLGTLAGALLIIGIALKLMTPLLPGMLIFAKSLALIGVGVLAIGLGLLTVSAGLTAFAGAVAVSGAEIVAGITLILTAIINLIPLVATQIANGIGMFAQALALNAPIIGEAVLAIITTILELIGTTIPQIASMLVGLLIDLLTIIADNTPIIVEKFADILIGFINKIAEKTPEIVSAGVNLIISFINGLATAIRENDEAIFAALGNLISAIVEFVITGLQALVSRIPVIGEGLAEEMESWKTGVRTALAPESFTETGTAAGTSLGTSMVTGIEATDTETPGSEKAQEFVNGIDKKGIVAQNEGLSLGNDATRGMDSADYNGSGANAGQGFVNGLNSKWTEVYNASYNLGLASIQGYNDSTNQHSPSKVAFKSGGFFAQGVINGLLSLKDRVYESSANLGKMTNLGFQNAISKAADLIDSDVAYQPTIRPVVDLSNVEAGSDQLYSMFGQKVSIPLTENYKNATMALSPSGEVTTKGTNGTNATGNTVTFIQNNNSPKALSRIEIYRQTRNQLAALKG